MSDDPLEFFQLEGAAKEQAEKSMRDRCMGGNIEETEESTALHLTKDEFVARMYKEPDGHELLELLEMGESQICERMGLCHGYIDDNNQVVFDVPGWNNLIAHLRIVNSV